MSKKMSKKKKAERGFCVGFLQDPKVCIKHEKKNLPKGTPCKNTTSTSICGWTCSGKDGYEMEMIQ